MAEDEFIPDYSSLSGAWLLDVSRSDTMRAYLVMLDTPEEHIQAQEAAEHIQQSRNAIALDRSRLTIYKHTAVNNYTETLDLGVETTTEAGNGVTKRFTASLIDDDDLGGYLVVINIVHPGGRNLSLVDARRLEEGGHAHSQTLTVQDNNTGANCTIRRTWVRVPMTDVDLHRLGRQPEG